MDRHFLLYACKLTAASAVPIIALGLIGRWSGEEVLRQAELEAQRTGRPNVYEEWGKQVFGAEWEVRISQSEGQFFRLDPAGAYAVHVENVEQLAIILERIEKVGKYPVMSGFVLEGAPIQAINYGVEDAQQAIEEGRLPARGGLAFIGMTKQETLTHDEFAQLSALTGMPVLADIPVTEGERVTGSMQTLYERGDITQAVFTVSGIDGGTLSLAVQQEIADLVAAGLPLGAEAAEVSIGFNIVRDRGAIRVADVGIRTEGGSLEWDRVARRQVDSQLGQVNSGRY